ncbi:MAG: hypothetical protein HRU26_12060 [Psychroserpens sp.]|nr:hypothetical protein [Psychroserpens sp.]
MRKKQFNLLVVICIAFVTVSSAQHKKYTIKNDIGIIAGLTQYDISTDNFKTKSGSGFTGGLTATVDLPHKWYTVSYGLQLSQNSMEIEARESMTATSTEMVEYDMMAAQLSFLFHAKILGSNLTLDLGPQLQYNGQLELSSSSQEDFIISGYSSLRAEEISEISPFNVNGLVGASAGIGAFKLRVMYSYGFTNILRKLNDEDLVTTPNNDDFDGNQNLLMFALQITF